MVNEKEKSRISPKTTRNIPKVMGIRSGKMKINIPVTKGTPAMAEGILKLMNKIPRATKYPPAVRYRKSG
jgi:hypothetical protein